jgi:hypothetical protein
VTRVKLFHTEFPNALKSPAYQASCTDLQRFMYYRDKPNKMYISRDSCGFFCLLCVSLSLFSFLAKTTSTKVTCIRYMIAHCPRIQCFPVALKVDVVTDSDLIMSALHEILKH